jgi:Rho GDP-dissociation inhibitor
VVAEPDDPRKVIVNKLAFVVEGRDDLEIDLSGDLDKKSVTFVIKEGVQFKIRIDFIVQGRRRDLPPSNRFSSIRSVL